MIKCLKEVRFIKKKNVDEKNFLLTLGISSNDFFRILKKNCDKVSNKYNVILRLNCEGVEDSIIYSAQKYFKKKLVLILGSLKDVKYCKSQEAYENLIKFMKNKNIPFIFFSSSPKSWLKAHEAIIKVLKSK